MKFYQFCFFVVATFTTLSAQMDSVIFLNGNYMVGEAKEMDRGVLTIETDYSDSDFKIEWKGVREIYTESEYLITLMDGRRYNGRLESTGLQQANLLTDDGQSVPVGLVEVVYLKEIDQSFASRLYAAIDIGFSITKAQDLRQLDVRSNIGYLAERWWADASYNRLRSTQADTEPLERTDASLTFRYFLPKDWYLLASTSFLSNTEQKLKLRTTGKVGGGKYMIHTNRTYWGVTGGINFNNEVFSNDNPDRQSLEGFLGTELNMYDIGDLNLLTKAVAYPSFTEAGRWRFDFIFDAKYDLPLDFYIKLGVTFNYDNQPTEGASQSDYIFQTGFGWEW